MRQVDQTHCCRSASAQYITQWLRTRNARESRVATRSVCSALATCPGMVLLLCKKRHRGVSCSLRTAVELSTATAVPGFDLNFQLLGFLFEIARLFWALWNVTGFPLVLLGWVLREAPWD